MKIEEAKKKALEMTQLETAWYARNLVIVNRDAKLVPFVLNTLQKQLAYNLNLQKSMGFPVRAYLLKSRKIGFSTYVEARFFMHSVNQRNIHALVIAHTGDSTAEIFRMTQTFDRNLPEYLYLPHERDTAKQIGFAAPHNSRVQVLFAGGKDIGRSMTPGRVHMSEYLFFPYEKTFLGVMNSVPENPDTEVIMESTANGAAGKGYEMYMDRVNYAKENPTDMDGFQALFFSWLDVPWYRKRLPKGYELGKYDDEELRLKALGADPEQIYWRRKTIPERCEGSPDLFKQEYPATFKEAFLTSARAAFPPSIIQYHTTLIEDEKNKPLGKYKFTWKEGQEDKVAVPCECTEMDVHGWHIWKWPKANERYTIGADISTGKLSDPSDPKSGSDFSAMAIKARGDNEIVATWHGKIDPDLLGAEMKRAGRYYNNAWLCPEANAVGMATLTSLRGYPNIYQRDGNMDDATVQPLSKLGFLTTNNTRPYLIEKWFEASRQDEVGGFEGQMRVFDQTLLDEEMSFVVTATGKKEHKVGCHDDMLFACMLSHIADLHCPGKNHKMPTPEPVRLEERDLALPGVIDPGPAYFKKSVRKVLEYNLI